MKRIFTLILAIWALTANAQNFEWTPQTSHVTTSLRDVFFVDNLTGWAVGEQGVILKTSDGGQAWTSQTSGTDERLQAVFFFDADTGWTVGGVNATTMLKTVDGGLNWEDIVPPTISTWQILDVAFADAKTGWVISRDSIFISRDGGASWAGEDYLGDPSQLSHKALAVTSDSTAYVAGQSKRTTPSNSYADVFNRRPYDAPAAFGGSAASSFQTDDNLRSIAFSSAATGFAGGNKGVVYRLEPYPNNLSGPWIVNLDLSAAGASYISSISFPGENTGMINASTDISGTTYSLIYHTGDAGDTWSATPDSIQELLSTALHAPEEDVAWIVGHSGKIYKGIPSTVGIRKSGLDLGISIYPNPASDFIYVELNAVSHGTVSYTLNDVSGRLIKNDQWHSTSSDSRFSIDISEFRNGVYLLNLNTDEGHTNFRILKN